MNIERDLQSAIYLTSSHTPERSIQYIKEHFEDIDTYIQQTTATINELSHRIENGDHSIATNHTYRKATYGLEIAKDYKNWDDNTKQLFIDCLSNSTVDSSNQLTVNNDYKQKIAHLDI